MSHSLAAIQMADALVAAQVEAANRRAQATTLGQAHAAKRRAARASSRPARQAQKASRRLHLLTTGHAKRTKLSKHRPGAHVPFHRSAPAPRCWTGSRGWAAKVAASAAGDGTGGYVGLREPVSDNLETSAS